MGDILSDTLLKTRDGSSQSTIDLGGTLACATRLPSTLPHISRVEVQDGNSAESAQI